MTRSGNSSALDIDGLFGLIHCGRLTTRSNRQLNVSRPLLAQEPQVEAGVSWDFAPPEAAFSDLPERDLCRSLWASLDLHRKPDWPRKAPCIMAAGH